MMIILMAMQCLIIDTSTTLFQVGILHKDRFRTFYASSDDIVTGFSRLMAPLLQDFTFDTVIFCGGPGKLLGIRTAIIFVRTLKIIYPDLKIFSYNTLAMAYNTLTPQKRDGTICIRKNNMQYYVFENDQIHPIEYEMLRLRPHPIYCLETQHHSIQPHPVHNNTASGDKNVPSHEMDPIIFTPISYNLENYGDVIFDLAIPNEAVETIYDPQCDYKKWEPIRHR